MKRYQLFAMLLILAMMVGCGPEACKFTKTNHGPLFFDYAGHGNKSNPNGSDPCPTCGQEPGTDHRHGNSELNDDRRDNDQHSGNGEDNNDHENCGPVGAG